MDPNERVLEARRFFLQQFVGFSETPEEKIQEIYAKGMMICARGDGELHPRERAWVRGYFANTGASDAIMAMIETYTGEDDLVELLNMDARTAQAAARNLIFDAFRVCEADGALTTEERQRIVQVGETMGLTAGDIRQVEAAYQVYKAAIENKMATLFPGMAPYQD
ncbi:MAG: TerB family tellurite resistance protein [Myxococcota bacterium]